MRTIRAWPLFFLLAWADELIRDRREEAVRGDAGN